MQHFDAKWRVLAGTFIGYIFDCLDLTLLAVALPYIISELGISLVEAGAVGTATFFGISLSTFVIGWYADRFGRKSAFIASLLSFGILTGAIALANTATQLIVLRVLGGLSLGGLWGICAAYINETWPPNQRALATSFVIGAMPVGQGIAAAVASVIIPLYGWRVLFILGSTSILWAIFIYFFMPESEVWKGERRALAESDGVNSKGSVSVRELFSKQLIGRTIAGTLAAGFSLTAVWGAATWFPTFLVKERGWDTVTMSQWMMVYSVGAGFGFLLSGYLADKIGRKTVLYALFAIGTLALPFVVVAPSGILAFVGALFCGFAISFAGLFGTIFAEMFPTHIRTLGACFCFNCGRGISALGPFTLGIVATQYSLGTGIVVCALGYLLAAITTFFLPVTGEIAKVLSDEKNTTQST